MKKITLLDLELKNFKGVKSFKLDLQGQNASVYGDNETGKTTQFDAFTYLLFDKDSQNKKSFSIKTIDSNGKELQGLEHEVSAIFLIDGSRLELKKIYREKWTKKRGSAKEIFEGNTTDYFINSASVKANEYNAKIKEIISEDIFKLLTSPSYFNEQLKWEERRKILIEISRDVSTQEIINTNPKLKDLNVILQSHSVDEYRKIIKTKKSNINKELEKIPTRIDEVHLGMPDTKFLNKSELENSLSQINDEYNENLATISSIKNGTEINKKKNELDAVKFELVQIENTHNKSNDHNTADTRLKIEKAQYKIKSLNFKKEEAESRKVQLESRIKFLDASMHDLRTSWNVLNAKELTFNESDTCSACGQQLPVETAQEHREKELVHFNQKKASKLEEIRSEGIQKKEEHTKLSLELDKVVNEIASSMEEITAKDMEIGTLTDELSIVEAKVIPITENKSYQDKLSEEKALKDQLSNLQELTQESIQDLQNKNNELLNWKKQVETDLSKFGEKDKSMIRIEELREQEKQLAAEYEKYESQLFLTEEFIRTKVSLLEERINSKFKHAKFKLFKQQINGGLEECCETIYNGVPYSTGLNNAAKINVGLDIIQTFSEFYQVKAPIFVDNAESVTNFFDTNMQLIKLIVSESDKVLRVETDDKELEEAV